MSDTQRPLKSRAAAHEYLCSRWGLEVAKSYLAELAYHKRGPRYSTIAGRTYYDPDDLDAWVRSQMTEGAAAE